MRFYLLDRFFDMFKGEQERFRVTIFGSARVKKGDRTYNMVYQLAKMIGAMNLDIVTGGGPGLMEAATSGHNKGNKNRKAHSFGLLINIPNEQRINNHLDIKQEYSRFSERLDNFMSLSNAVVVAPGGIGTLLELFYAWQLLQVKQICDIPIILIGDNWGSLINWIKKNPVRHRFMDKKDMHSIFIVKSNTEAMRIIKQAHALHESGGKNICLNIKKYKVK